MSDRSVQANDLTQSVVVTGDGNTVTLSFGATGIVLPLVRPQFAPSRRRPRRELDLLRPGAGAIPFEGRADLMQELRSWLDGEPDISVHAITGRAGTGKTRLAVELCRVIDPGSAAKGPWLAGFIPPADLASVVDRLATQSFTWQSNTLLLLDYAAQIATPLGRWLDRLATERLTTKLRILLLEREAPEGFGWWRELTDPPLQSQAPRRELFHADRPRALPDLASLEERRALMRSAFEAARGLAPDTNPRHAIPDATESPDFDTRLGEPRFGNPLTLGMAGIITRDRSPDVALALRRLEMARHFGRRELARLLNLAASNGIERETMRHVAAFNGLAGGLPLRGLRETLGTEITSSLRDPARLDSLLELLEQELPIRPGTDTSEPRLTTIQPDLIGEAVIIEALSGSEAREAEAPALVQRGYALGQRAAAEALMRLVQDFGYAAEDPTASEHDKRTAARVLAWLSDLARATDNPEALEPLVLAFPRQSVVLHEIALEITERLANRLVGRPELNSPHIR